MKLGRLHPPPWLVLLAFTVGLRLVSIIHCELSGRDEPRVAGIAREMALSGDWAVPRLNGQEFLEYPSLGYAPIALFLSLSGSPGEGLTVIPVALLGVGSVLLTYLLGKKLAGERVGLAAGYILSTTMGFFILHRRCLVDPMLLFSVTLSLHGFGAGVMVRERRFRHFSLFYLGMGMGFLSKGLLGIGIPAAAAAIYLTVRRDLSLIRALRPIRGALLFAIPIALWAGALWLRGELGLFEEVLRQSAWRFFSSSADHSEPFHYYLPHIFPNLLPWLVLPLALLWLVSFSRRRRPLAAGERTLAILALIWFLTVFLGLSAASAKRPLYLGPVYPPFALLAALGWNRVREEFPRLGRIEVPALAVLFLFFGGLHFLRLLPEEREDSYRPVFEAARREGADLPVYLYGGRRAPSEALRGAAVFYLGVRTRVLDGSPAVLPGERGGMVVVASFSEEDRQGDPFLDGLPARGFRRVFEKRIGRPIIQVLSSAPRDRSP